LRKVDLNVDIGEGFPFDEALLEFATSANVCCGEHAGSLGLTYSTVEMCRSKGVRVGAHPGFPDRENMGRREPSLEELEGYAESLRSQPGRVAGAAYVKPHGAFYNILVCTARDSLVEKAWQIAVTYYEAEDRLMLLSDENFSWAIRDHFPVLADPVISEGFADRGYRPDGTLIPRSEPGAILEDPVDIKRQVLELARRVDSICLHGDTPGCLDFAELVYKTLVDAGYEVGF